VYAAEKDALNRQLDRATRGFLDAHTTIATDQRRGSVIVTLSMLFQWYQQDFLDHDYAMKSSTKDPHMSLIAWVAAHANEPLATNLNALVNHHPSPKLQFAKYDWRVND
jgi:hypothetical protein